MATTVRVTLVLTGAYAGKDVTLRGRKFRNGRCEIIGDAIHVANLIRYYGKCYQAHPEYSDALREAEERDGKCYAQANRDGAARPEVSSGVQPDGGGTPEVSGDERVEPATDAPGQAGSVPDGNGREDARLSEPDESVQKRIREALAHLDADNDEHWTSAGKPAMSAVADFFGSADVTRAVVEAVEPGFDRERARQCGEATSRSEDEVTEAGPVSAQ